jgi:nicotinamide riboside kinase
MVKTLVIGIKVTDKDHIPIERRVEWLREMAPTAQIVELRGVPAVDEIDFAKTLGVILGSMGALPTHIFASEPYMRAFAENIGAALIPNDPDRLSQSARACDVRMDPYAHFDQLPAGVRAYYAGRFALVGPDGVGKTMLANVLAKHYQTVFAQEHLRVDPSAQTMLRTISGTLELMAIQQARIEAMARQCRRIVICDSEPLSLGVWYEQLTGRSDFPFEKVAKKYKADRYFYVAKYDQTSREPKRAKFEARLRDILWLTDVRRDEVVWTAVAEADANDPKKNYMLNKACASIDELLLRLKSNGRRHLSP